MTTQSKGRGGKLLVPAPLTEEEVAEIEKFGFLITSIRRFCNIQAMNQIHLAVKLGRITQNINRYVRYGWMIKYLPETGEIFLIRPERIMARGKIGQGS